MSSKSKIEWTETTWNPIVGCTHVSAGCDNCYAARDASGRLAHTPTYAGLAVDGRFTGEVRLLPDRLNQPLRWRKPRRVFVNSMSDLFHPAVPDDYIVEVFSRMWWAPQHTFQVLTKRHGRMRSLTPRIEAALREREADLSLVDCPTPLVWPLPNVWLGVSVENQQWADTRIPALLDTPAAVRWLSCEPLLGPVDLRGPVLAHRRQHVTCAAGLQWVVAGGESGPGARPMHPEWPRRLRDQCAAAEVPFFFKQFGEYGPRPRRIGATGVHDYSREVTVANDGTVYAPGDLAYPDGPRYRDAIRAGHDRASLTAMYRVGKKAAGRELDGQVWEQYPELAQVAR